MRRLLPLALLPALVLAGCSASPATSGSGGAIRVVASTDVWGDIARQVGGSAVQVDSIITGQDPHEYQADTRDQLAVSRAQLVIENGGGYDDFLTRLVANAPKGTAVLNAVDVSGLESAADDGDFNEHVWYDLPAVGTIAAAIERELVRIAPAHRAALAANLTRFQAALGSLEAEERTIRSTAEGQGVAITEPVPLYMTAALGLVNKTPEAFSHAVEEGDDVAPAVLREQLALFSGHEVAMLAVNEQTTGATTTQTIAAAEAAGVPVVGVRETLPAGKDYLRWMRGDLAAMKAALAR